MLGKGGYTSNIITKSFKEGPGNEHAVLQFQNCAGPVCIFHHFGHKTRINLRFGCNHMIGVGISCLSSVTRLVICNANWLAVSVNEYLESSFITA